MNSIVICEFWLSEEDWKINQRRKMNEAGEKSASTVSLESYKGWMVGDRCQWTFLGETKDATVRWIGKLKGYISTYVGLEIADSTGGKQVMHEGEVVFHTIVGSVGLAEFSEITDFRADSSPKMTEDYFNKLSIVPLAADYSILRQLYRSVGQAPVAQREPLPGSRVSSRPFLPDAKTSQSARRACVEYGNEIERVLADRTARLNIDSSPSSRPVIYRYIDVVVDSFALLEAIHFELFLPDRPDLRFLAVPIDTIPQTVEGDYFHVMEADLMREPSFGVKMIEGQHTVIYPVVWEARDPKWMDFTHVQRVRHAYAYVLKNRQPITGGVLAVSSLHDRQLLLRSALFADQEDREQDSLLRGSVRSGAAAHLYPVEPPIAPAMGEVGDVREPDSYIARVRAVRTSAQRDAARVVSRVRPLTDRERAELHDRFDRFDNYDQPGDVERMLELFLLGCQMREVESNSDSGKNEAADAGDMRIDESIVLEALRDESVPLNRARKTLDAIYGRRGPVQVLSDPQRGPAPLAGDLRLNEEQGRALHYYTMSGAPRVFCILSPPGSGKTTVAAAMAAAVAKSVKEAPRSYLNKKKSGGEVQLLLSVQNVAVNNIGSALKKMDYGGGKVIYTMKSTKQLDPNKPAPFDFFDLAGPDSLMGWRALRKRMDMAKGEKYEKEKKMYDEQLTSNMRDCEKDLLPNIKVILSTVDLVLKRTTIKIKMSEALEKVTRVIIDEASLLTEAALFCLMRRFPEALIVLIGDDKQLPPFRYDIRELGSQLAGRPALTIAMNTGRVPVVELVKVYRAPQSLIAPYNRLAYNNNLKSNVPEREFPLSDLGFIKRGLAQLLFVKVMGKQVRDDRSMSLYNLEELKVAHRLLSRFPKEWTKHMMIICLYDEQKRRLQAALGNDYTVLTVDSSQGKEKPIVVLLTTRTVVPREGLFFYSKQRCNVSISRQQQALIVLGFEHLLITNEPWSTVVHRPDFSSINAADI